MKRRTLLLAIGLIAALLFLAGDRSTVLAQAECSETEQAFSIPEAFPLDGDDWLVVPQENGSLTEIGPDSFSTAGTSGLANGVNLYLTLPTAATITHVEFDIPANASGDAGVSVQVCYDLECSDTDLIILNANFPTPETFSSDDEYEDVLVIILGLNGVGAPYTATMENLVIEGVLGACLFRPVHDADVLDEFSSGDVYILAVGDGSRVYAIDDATVQTVIHDTNGYAVRLLINGATTVLYSELGSVFVSVGDVIEGGCVLGHATESGAGSPVGESSFNYRHDPDLGDWHDYGESLSVTPCNQPESNCINPNPHFDNDAVGWSSRYAIADSLNTGDDSVMLIPKTGEIYQPGFVVDTDETWYVTLVVGIKAPATAGSVTVEFAGVFATMPVNTFGGEYVTLTTTGISPAADGTTEFRIDNDFSGTSTLKVTFACLHMGDAVIAPPSCYFGETDLNYDAFELEGGATLSPGPALTASKYFTLPEDAAIRAPISISAFSDTNTDFTLRLGGRVLVIADTPVVTANIVDTGTEDELEAIDDYAFVSLFASDVAHTFELAASVSLDGDLLITNNSEDTAIITKICLSSDAGVWPGYDNSDYAAGPLLPVNCTECQPPATLIDVVAWLNWLGCVFRYLIFCLLYTLVNNVWNTVLAIVSGIGLFGRWLGKAITVVAVWLWQAVGRLLATLMGNAIPILNAILAWILSLPFVRDVLDAAQIAALWIDGVIQFIVGVINLFVSAVRFVGVLVTVVGSVWVAFIEGLSTASEFSVPLPDCYDSGSTFYDVCLLLKVLNFIVAQDYAGPAIVALFVAVAISILWHAGRQIKDEVERVFES